MDGFVRLFGVLVFGVVLPGIILYQAHVSISSLKGDVSYATTLEELSDEVDSAKSENWNVNHIALYSLLYVEHANQKTMQNKQAMKASIVNIGFAVISIGMMLIVIGIESDKDIKVKGAVYDFKFDIRTGSAGVAVFLVGAVMATLGGLLKNSYQTSEIPSYTHVVKSDYSSKHEKSVSAYKACRNKSSDFELCFAQVFFQINKSDLQ
ncbi:hypothetical protein [Marinobacter sp.]|uniref:hypothetical protein n=1 Tax=Marinobacter sp. TaxID=50741 RepID=UPI0023558FD4|nr:hypothetical protein [Marinobacter sp.]